VVSTDDSSCPVVATSDGGLTGDGSVSAVEVLLVVVSVVVVAVVLALALLSFALPQPTAANARALTLSKTANLFFTCILLSQLVWSFQNTFRKLCAASSYSGAAHYQSLPHKAENGRPRGHRPQYVDVPAIGAKQKC
jgi:hypothetical protein